MVLARRGRAIRNVGSDPFPNASSATSIYPPNIALAFSLLAFANMRVIPYSYYRSEALLRRGLFEETGGMYPELITRPDIKVFLPPIGGLTVYICESYLSMLRSDI